MPMRLGTEGTDSVNLLVSILVRYPEVGSLRVDPQGETLQLTFLLTREVVPKSLQRFREVVKQSVSVLAGLEDRTIRHCTVEVTTCHPLTSIRIIRDIGSFSREELTVLISLVRDSFGKALAIDGGQVLLEDEQADEEEAICAALDSLRNRPPKGQVTALREDGRVMVYGR